MLEIEYIQLMNFVIRIIKFTQATHLNVPLDDALKHISNKTFYYKRNCKFLCKNTQFTQCFAKIKYI